MKKIAGKISGVKISDQNGEFKSPFKTRSAVVEPSVITEDMRVAADRYFANHSLTPIEMCCGDCRTEPVEDKKKKV